MATILYVRCGAVLYIYIISNINIIILVYITIYIILYILYIYIPTVRCGSYFVFFGAVKCGSFFSIILRCGTARFCWRQNGTVRCGAVNPVG